ncbi:MAG: alpha/beta fold hydrolase [Syntrophales bacterium]|nr:alpha/beta fold hydrolase [Syntrophales bacterium]MCU0554763.1 alpha/beta fold hydrolase [Syntrophales bacterium]
MRAFTRAILPLVLLAALAAPSPLRAEGELRLADLGDFRLEGGGVIRECRVGYRTFGALNPERSNAVLFPSWFGGTSQDLVNLGLIGPGKLADTSRWFVVAVDAFGNGVSSSPSNSRLQPGRAFPEFTVRDLVRAQHRVLTAYLGLERLHAVIGVSMGGMQALQWARTLPGVAPRAVCIAGTPRAAPSDLALYDAGFRALDAAGSLRASETWGPETLAALIALLALTPVQDRDRPPQDPEAVLARYDFTNWARQLKAIMGHDVYAGGTEREAARAIRAKLLIVVSSNDLLVSPEPSLALAAALKAETLVLESGCGHFAVLCEGEKIARAVSAFLNRKD